MARKLFFGLIILLVLISSCTSKAVDKEDTAKNDSIKKYLELASNLKLSKKLRQKYNDKAFLLVEVCKNDTVTRYYLSVLSFNYLILKDRDALKKTGHLLYEMSKATKDTLNLARYYRYKAGCFKGLLVNDSAFYYYLKAEKFYSKTSDKLGLAIVYNNKRELQYKFDDYPGANLSAKRAYKYFKETDNLKEQYNSLIAIGNTCTILREYKNSIDAFELALEILKKDNSIADPGICLNNIGNAYREQKDYKKAIYYLNLGLKNKNLCKNDPTSYGFLLNNLSYCKLQTKDFSGVPDMLYKSIRLMKDDDGVKESILSYVYLSNYFFAVHDTNKAQMHAEKALKIAKKCEAPYYYLTALTNAGSVDSKKAAKYIVEYHKIDDSLYYVEINNRNQYYSIQLETDDIRQEKEDAVTQKWIISAVSGFIILVIVLLLIITKQRVKQKEFQLWQSTQKANEEIYELMLVQKNNEEQARQDEKKRIAIELHDGVMNRLASTRLNLDILNRKNDSQTVEECLIHINEIYKIEQEVRNISHDLTLEIFNPSNSFINLINDFIAAQNKTFITQYKTEVQESINWNIISSDVKMNLFRIIQEASHNINKFAQAENAIISFIIDEDNLCLSITDDGKGFDTQKNNEGIGLKNIKLRVNNLNGKFVIQSSNKRTSLNIAIPLPN